MTEKQPKQPEDGKERGTERKKGFPPRENEFDIDDTGVENDDRSTKN